MSPEPHGPPNSNGSIATGRGPRRSSPVALKPDERAGEAVRRILAHLLEVIRDNAPGVLEDEDPEFLHQLRVTTRRARSALASLHGVLPEAGAAALAEELGWLGASTNACRDLDVHIEAVATPPGEAADSFEPVRELLGRSRAAAWEEAAQALRTERFRRLVESCQSLLSSSSAAEVAPPDADSPIKAVADERILAAHTRVLRRARKLDRKKTARAAHRLRIAGKRLRYLLELFRDLYPPHSLEPLLRDLKRLQDLLGDHQDAVVQQRRLAELASELGEDAAARRAVDEACSALAGRQRELWAAFTGQLGTLAASDEEYERLTGHG